MSTIEKTALDTVGGGFRSMGFGPRWGGFMPAYIPYSVPANPNWAYAMLAAQAMRPQPTYTYYAQPDGGYSYSYSY